MNSLNGTCPESANRGTNLKWLEKAPPKRFAGVGNINMDLGYKSKSIALKLAATVYTNLGGTVLA